MTCKVAGRLLVVVLIALLSVPAFAEQSKDQKKKQEEAKKQEEKKSNRKNSDIDNIGNRNINKGSINFMSLEKEIALGRQLAADVERQVKMIEDPTVTEYVNRVGQNLVRNSDAQVPFTIKVIESDEINAFALPGGFFYVNSGLIMAADDEAELAGVMAHEIAHVTARHGAENASKQQLMNIATIPLIFLGGPAGFGIRQAAGLAIPLGFLQFSRKAEAEADYLGLQYLYKTGYDPSAAVSFFEKLQAKESAKPGSVSKLFTTHPPTGDRIELSKKNIEDVLPDRDQYVVTTSEFQKIKMQLAELDHRRPLEEENNRPTLRRRSPTGSGRDSEETVTTTSTDDEDQKKEGEDREPEDDDRPTLKRRR